MEHQEAQKLFAELFKAEATDLFTAAGRINVIGEHVDYCGGKVFPAALNLRCNVYGRKNGENVIRVAASDFKEVITLDIDKLDSYKNLKWGNYQAGGGLLFAGERNADRRLRSSLRLHGAVRERSVLVGVHRGFHGGCAFGVRGSGIRQSKVGASFAESRE